MEARGVRSMCGLGLSLLTPAMKCPFCACPLSSRRTAGNLRCFLGFNTISPVSTFMYMHSLQACIQTSPLPLLDYHPPPHPTTRHRLFDKVQLQWPYSCVRSHSEVLLTTAACQGRWHNSSRDDAQQMHLANIWKCLLNAKICSHKHFFF